MELRNYQHNQLHFLESKMSTQFNSLFDSNIALCSPTGSGKSYVMLQFVKNYFKEHSNSKIVISTGFNNLVKQFYENAQLFGIPAVILAGKNHCACTHKIQQANKKKKSDINKIEYNTATAFYAPKSKCCSPNKCIDCKLCRTTECIYNAIIEKIESPGNLLIVTNHSTLVAKQQLLSQNTIGGFIDECQTFADFYEAHLRIEVNYLQLRSLYSYMEKDFALRNNPFTKVFKQACINGTLTKPLIEKVLDLKTMSKNYKGETKTIADCFPLIARNLEAYLDVEPQMDNYIYPQKIEGQNIGILVDKFFDSVNLGNNFCLSSATVDSYTKSIFGDIQDKDIYQEKDFNTIDYTKSTLYLYDGMTPQNIAHFLKQSQQYDKGLLLSTRLDLVEKLGNKLWNYDIIINKKDFENDEKQILAGSKSLFQGIDIPGIEFVMLNKLPFSRYDESYRKKMRYFESRGHANSFSFYTKPYTENQLIQSMGRLWRTPGDSGNIAIFDSKACKKHYAILKNALECRKGIKIKEYKNGCVNSVRI